MKDKNQEENILDCRRFILSDEYKGNFQVPIKDRVERNEYDFMLLTEVVYELNDFEKKYDYLMDLIKGKIAEYEIALDYSFNITTQRYLELFIKELKELLDEMVEW